MVSALVTESMEMLVGPAGVATGMSKFAWVTEEQKTTSGRAGPERVGNGDCAADRERRTEGGDDGSNRHRTRRVAGGVYDVEVYGWGGIQQNHVHFGGNFGGHFGQTDAVVGVDLDARVERVHLDVGTAVAVEVSEGE